MKKKAIIIIAFIASLFAISLTTYTVFRNNASSSTDVTTAEFAFNITTAELSLKDTITNDSQLVPGAEGHIVLNIDLTGTDVSTDYSIIISRTNLPTNLKFYSDQAMTTEVNSITGTYTLGSSATTTKDLYWKWLYVDDETSNTNDSLFMNQDLSVLFNATFNQQIGGGN